MAEPSSFSPVSTLVIRLWREWSVAGSRWRGRIEHVQSGESAAFLNLEGMLDFLQRFGVKAQDDSRAMDED